MSQATEQEVRELLGSYQSIISDILQGAWSDWLTAEYQHWRCNRSRAGFVWEQVIDRALRAFDGDPRIHPMKRNESFLFLLDGTLAFRFKKSDELGLTSNIPTQAMLAFHDPEQDLPGMPEVTRVDIVYVLNKLQTAVLDVMVVGREREQVSWTFSLLPSRANVVPMPARVDAETVAESEKKSSGLVRAKGVRREGEGGESGAGEAGEEP